ncbi:MAG: hypothetical protein HN333_05280 [Rhodospirillaceae bacterium]|nr:hypothetical protein [Rhodospirillaceae bacterium]MBT4425311.1 hypothetical protein [Rhodospirillaceae bacterium]
MLVALPLSAGTGQAGEGLKGELHAVGSRDSVRIERVEFDYDGQNFNVARSRKTHDLRGAGDVQRRLDSLRSPKSSRPRRQIQRVTSDASGAFSVPEETGGAALRIELESWEDVPHRPAAPELQAIGGMLTGDDISLSHVAVEADGRAYYFAEDGEAGGTFGEIDLDTNATTRLLEGLPAAEDVVDDPLNGELILIGEDEIAQIQPAPVAHVVSRHNVPPGEALESGAVDGGGHLFVRRGDGEILFVDYSASDRIGAAGNFTAAARVGPPVAAARQNAVRDNGWVESVSWLEILAGLAVALVLIPIYLFFRAGNIRHAGAGGQGKTDKLGSMGDEIVYSRWPEDWSQLKVLVASMSTAERAELGSRLERNPRMLDDARALIRWPLQGGMSELRGGPAFGAALAGFARGERRVEWQSDDGAREDGLALKVAHQLAFGAAEDWSRVIVEASLGGAAFQALAEQDATVAAEVEMHRASASALARKWKKDRKSRHSVGEAAVELGRFDIRGMFERVARRLVDEGVATQLGLDAADGLQMSGDEKTIGGALEGVLRVSLGAEHQAGAAPPSLAVMAYEEKGEIHLIVLRAGAAAEGVGAAHLTGAALRDANQSAGLDGGRAWVEPEEEGQVCRFTLSGKKASKSARRRARKRSGWRPAQPKAVWNMRSEGR